MIVYSIAPCSSSVARTRAMLAAFCPIATYTQKRSLPFWLMIVSRSTAVLPVWRSPMTSSRCPRPIGIMASIDMMPVCTGSSTRVRVITPGAMTSIGARCFAAMGPRPSIGSPSGLTVRPSSSGPTGTSTMLPVVRTSSPSLMCSYLPRTTARTWSSSRLRARPSTSPGNCTISLAMTPVRPKIWTIPSPTLMTRPTSADTVSASKSFRRCLMTSLISLDLMANSVRSSVHVLRARQLVAQLLQPRRDAGVDHPVADPEDQAADDGGVHQVLEPDLAAQLSRQARLQLIGVRSAEWDRRRRGRAHAAGLLVGQQPVLLDDPVQLADPVGCHQEPGEVRDLGAAAAREQRDGRLLAALGGDRGVGEDTRHLGPAEDVADRLQPLRPFPDLAVLSRQLEDGACVALRRGAGHQFLESSPTCAIARSIRDRWSRSSSVSPTTFSVAATTRSATWPRTASTAFWRSASISRVALSTIRLASSWARPRSSVRSCSAERPAPSTISAPRWRASLRWPSASARRCSASWRARSAAASCSLIWR